MVDAKVSMFSLTLKQCVSALQSHTDSELTVRGSDPVMFLSDENHIDVFRSGFISEEELKARVIAALSFTQFCGPRPRVQTIEVEECARCNNGESFAKNENFGIFFRVFGFRK